jgi:hypothetical protein
MGFVLLVPYLSNLERDINRTRSDLFCVSETVLEVWSTRLSYTAKSLKAR